MLCDVVFACIDGDIAKSLTRGVITATARYSENQTCCNGYNLCSSKIFQKTIIAAKKFSLRWPVLSCSFSETLQIISNGQNPS